METMLFDTEMGSEGSSGRLFESYTSSFNADAAAADHRVAGLVCAVPHTSIAQAENARWELSIGHRIIAKGPVVTANRMTMKERRAALVAAGEPDHTLALTHDFVFMRRIDVDEEAGALIAARQTFCVAIKPPLPFIRVVLFLQPEPALAVHPVAYVPAPTPPPPPKASQKAATKPPPPRRKP
jgi:hypothetical protein